MRLEVQNIIRYMRNNEATDTIIYRNLTKQTKSMHNKEILEGMAQDEARHCDMWNKYIDGSPKINMFRVYLFTLLGKIFGLVFTINLLESREGKAINAYQSIINDVPEAKSILEDEIRHEAEIAILIKQEGLNYISSIVLGLNDALVELTGALAGFTFALNDNNLIGLAGFITGVSATLAMASSEYLANRADKTDKHPIRAAIYTGITYIITVILLLLPYIFFDTPIVSLIICLINAGIIIFIFTYIVSIIRRAKFFPMFFEMIIISFGVAMVSFIIGWLAKFWFKVDM